MDLKNGMVIKCNSEEEAQEFIKEAYKQGFEWFLTIYGNEEKTFWDTGFSEIYYYLEDNRITWGTKDFDNDSIEYSTLKEKIKTMTKSDLKNGMVVELQNKGMYLVHNGMLLNQKGTGHMSLYCRRGYYGNEYNEDLTRPNDSNLDIIRVYKSDAHNLKDMFEKDRLELIWERKEQPKLSEKDKKKIKVALKKVKEICSSYNDECKKDCEFNVDGLCIFADDPSDFELDNLFKD